MVIDESMIGAPVFDRDGHQIGTVKEIDGSAFKVDVPLAFDFWLHFDGAQSSSIDGVVMRVDSDHLDEFKLDNPEDATPHGTRTAFEGQNEVERHEVRPGSDSHGVPHGTIVSEVVTGQHPHDDVIVRGGLNEGGLVRSSERYGVHDGTTVGSDGVANDDIATTGVTDWGDVSSRFRTDWQANHETTGTWEEFEPGYHFGYEMAHDPRFHGRPWEDVEPDIETEWISWSGRSGAMSDGSSWERVRMSVRHAWDSARDQRRAA